MGGLTRVTLLSITITLPFYIVHMLFILNLGQINFYYRSIESLPPSTHIPDDTAKDRNHEDQRGEIHSRGHDRDRLWPEAPEQ